MKRDAGAPYQSLRKQQKAAADFAMAKQSFNGHDSDGGGGGGSLVAAASQGGAARRPALETLMISLPWAPGPDRPGRPDTLQPRALGPQCTDHRPIVEILQLARAASDTLHFYSTAASAYAAPNQAQAGSTCEALAKVLGAVTLHEPIMSETKPLEPRWWSRRFRWEPLASILRAPYVHALQTIAECGMFASLGSIRRGHLDLMPRMCETTPASCSCVYF